MSLSDPIGDMLARIKNSLMRNHKKVELPSSKFKVKIAEVLKNEGYIIDYKVTEEKKPNLEINLKYSSGNPVINSIERVITVSIDRKEGVKITVEKDQIQLFVASTTSGEGKETLKANYNSETLTISFNARYLLDIASAIEYEKIIMNLNDPVSPVLIQDNSDKHSYYVIMPMKI